VRNAFAAMTPGRLENPRVTVLLKPSTGPAARRASQIQLSIRTLLPAPASAAAATTTAAASSTIAIATAGTRTLLARLVHLD
jgi:hypothetical protein